MGTIQLRDFAISIRIDPIFQDIGFYPPQGQDRDRAVDVLERYIHDCLQGEVETLMEYAKVELAKVPQNCE